jgi:hypothetical protein
MASRATWRPHTGHGELSTDDRKSLPSSVYAYPSKRKEPLTDARHVRNALARFDQVKDISDDERAKAFANIRKAARHYEVEMKEGNWRDLGRKPHTKNPAQPRGKSSAR